MECVWAYCKGAHTYNVGTECTEWEYGIRDVHVGHVAYRVLPTGWPCKA